MRDLRSALGNRAMGQLVQRKALKDEIVRDLGPVPDPKEWTKDRTGDARPLFIDVAKRADAGRVPDVKVDQINTARNATRGEKDIKPGLNFVTNLDGKAECGFVDAKGVYRGPHLPVSLDGPLPKIAISMGPKAFQHGKDGAFGTLRHEMKHAEHYMAMLNWLGRWRQAVAKSGVKLDDAAARTRFDTWVDSHKGIGKVDHALLFGERKANTANTELLAYVEGFINIFHLRPMTPSVQVAVPDYPPALYQLRRAGEEYNRAETSVKAAALARLGDYVKSVLTAQERASLRDWLKWLLAQGKGPPAAGDAAAKLVHNDFKPVEPFLTKALALVP